MGLSAPWYESLDIVDFQTAKIKFWVITKWALVPHTAGSIFGIVLQTVKKITRV